MILPSRYYRPEPDPPDMRVICLRSNIPANSSKTSKSSNCPEIPDSSADNPLWMKLAAWVLLGTWVILAWSAL